MRDDEFEVLPAGEMRSKYGLTAENRPTIILNPAKIPRALHPLIPLAEQFGVADDLIRQDILAKTPATELESMQRAVQSHSTALLEWLAGPKANGPRWSKEYIAFSALLMAADGC